MKPYTRSIVELFDGKKRFLIPLYQRQYAWKITPQLELLWEDIFRAVDRINSDRTTLAPHFMGAIVISQIKTYGKEVQAYEVIDGQQRLTTFQILLAALRDVAHEYGSAYEAEVNKYLLNEGVMATPLVERYKLWPSLMDRQSFISAVDHSADLSDIVPAGYIGATEVKRSTQAHLYFKERIRHYVLGEEETYEEQRMEILFEALKEGLAVVSIELETGDDPQTIFETLNSRGVDLTPSDLLRNFIFQRAKGLGQASGSLTIDKLYERHWLPLDAPFWQEIVTRGRQSRPRIDWMLVDHLSIQLGSNISVENLFETYRKWILASTPFESVEAELTAISSTAEFAKRILEKSKEDPLGRFGLFSEAFDVSTATSLVIYLAIILTEQDLKAGLAIIESYILRRDICGLPNKNYNNLFVGIIDKLKKSEEAPLAALQLYLSSRVIDIERWPDDLEFREKWLAREQYRGPRQPRLRHILESLESGLRNSFNENIEIRTNLTIEHIMPQKWREHWPILSSDGEDPSVTLEKEIERSQAVNRLGNLTLLTRELNASTSNGPFEIKLPALKAQSALALNRQLEAYDRWDEIAVNDRAEAMLRLAKTIWLPPEREEFPRSSSQAHYTLSGDAIAVMPPDGTTCSFTYGNRTFQAKINNGKIAIDGLEHEFNSFSAASRAVTNTSRNGWMDWYLQIPGQSQTVLADQWRRGLD